MNDVMTKDLEALKAENHQLREENQSLKAENYELRGELEAFMKQLDTSRLSLSRTKNALLGVKSILDLAIDE